MLGEPLLRRHARIPPDESLVRFLVIAPERTELVRYKLDRSPLLRTALEAGGWHIIKSDHLRPVPRRGAPDLADLEPLLGLDPIDRAPRRADAAVRRLTRPVSRRRQGERRARGTLSSPVAGSRA